MPHCDRVQCLDRSQGRGVGCPRSPPRSSPTPSAPSSSGSTPTSCSPTAFADWCLEALEANGALVFRDLHVDDATQVAFSKRLGRVETFNPKAEHPEIFLVTLDQVEEPVGRLPEGHVRLAHRRHDRGHPDHGHAAERPRRGDQRRRDRVRQHLRRLRRPHRRGEGALSLDVRVVHTIEASQRPVYPNPSPEQLAMWRIAPVEGAPARLAAPLGSTVARPRRHDRPRRRHGAPTRAGPSSTTCSTGPPRPSGCTATRGRSGDLVIWDNRGVLHRACPYDETSPRDMHRTTLFGDEPVQ